MFDIGIWEISLILIIALIVVGPDRLPTLATTVGRWVGKIRRMAQSVQHDIDRSIALQDQAKIRAQLNSIRQDAGELKKALSTALTEDVTDPLEHDNSAKQTSSSEAQSPNTPIEVSGTIDSGSAKEESHNGSPKP